jgi:hypothetical protein
MMNKKQTRREFVHKSSALGLACGAFALCPRFNLLGNILQDEVPDPKKLNYCGYVCPSDCPMYVATIENDTEKKKEAYTMWKIEERFGVAFDPEVIFCYGCKNQDKPEGVVLKNCTVRDCAIEKGYDCCIECKDLSDCDLDLWKRFPEFHKNVIEMQKKYQEASEKT